MGVGYALSAAVLFGVSTPAAKLLLRSLSPLMLSALLYLGAATGLSVYRVIAGSKSREAQIIRRDILPISGIIFFGGMLGPILMFLGLQRLSALSGSLLLNLEGPFTGLIAIGFMREYLGKREMLGAATVMVGGVLVSLQAGGQLGGSWVGALEIAAACLSWGLDNNLTQCVSLRDPLAIAQVKTSASGWCMLVAALWQSRGAIPAATSLFCAGAVGALCYGASIVLAIKALPMLGAARQSAYFATAPSIGAVASIVVFHTLPQLTDIAGAVVMAGGLAILLRERHDHMHTHEVMVHEHLHFHDEHHQHAPRSPLIEPHSHPHEHSALTHLHPHVSDAHHRHSHRST